MTAIGRTIGNYRIERLVGVGGMGKVYEAQHLHLERRVAIKALRSDTAGDPKVRQRLVREQQILDQVRHSNVVGLHDIHFEGDEVFLIMELAEGQNLEEVLEGGRKLPIGHVVDWTRQLLGALDLAHGKGVIHRDIKPANIMVLSDGSGVKLLDFGIARATDSAGLTQTGMVLGSPAYLPPERWEADEICPATDIYALGLCLYEALAGQPALYSDKGWHEYYKLHLEGDIAPLLSLRPDTPQWLADMVHKALQIDPRHRYQDASDMLAELEHCSGGATSGPADAHWTERAAGALDRPSGARSEQTRAFMAKAQKPYKRIFGGLAAMGGLAFLGLIAAAAIVAAAIVVYALVVKKPPPVFLLELTNHQEEPVDLQCTAGQGEYLVSWKEHIEPTTAAVIEIPSFPATCRLAGIEGDEGLVWTTPSWVSIEQLPQHDAEQGDATAPPDTEPEPAFESDLELLGITAPAKPELSNDTKATPSKKKASSPEPSVATVTLGKSKEDPVDSCGDLVAMEPKAAMGQMMPGEAFCLEAAITEDDSLVRNDKRSRLLIANAQARNDQVEWERLVRRHLEKISVGDPDMCLVYAKHHFRLYQADSKVDAIKYANYGLDNKGSLKGSQFVRRVYDLHKIRTMAALDMWKRHDEQYLLKRRAKADEEAERWRNQAKEYAREWLDYAQAASYEVKTAQQACMNAAGTKSYCE